MIVNTSSEKNFPQFTKKNILLGSKFHSFKTKPKDIQISTDPEVFFNNKKKNIILVWGLFFCVLIFFATYLLNVTWSTIPNTLKKAVNQPRFSFTVFFSLFIFVFNDVFLQILGHKVRSGKTLQHIQLKEWVGFVITAFFIQSITPFAIGAEAFAIWWFKKRGMSLQESCATVAVSTFSWFCGQFLITFPSIIYTTYNNWDNIVGLTVDSIYWLILVGISFDVFIWLMLFLISYNKHVHYIFAVFNNRVKYWLSTTWFGTGDVEYIPKSELTYQYLINHSFKRLYLSKLKSKTTIISILVFALQSMLNYVLFALITPLLDANANFWSFFHIINTATTANDFLPVPSAEGSLQLTIDKLASAFAANTGASQRKTSVLVWRFVTKYIGLFISVGYLAIFGLTPKHKIAQKHDQMWDTF